MYHVEVGSLDRYNYANCISAACHGFKKLSFFHDSSALKEQN